MTPWLRFEAMLLAIGAFLVAGVAANAQTIQIQEKVKVKLNNQKAQPPQEKKEDQKKESKQGAKGLDVKGQLTNADPFDKVRDGCHSKIYTFKMQANTEYVIDLKATEFDPYLRLEDSKGNQLAQDDDSGGNLQSQIRFVCPKTEAYRLIVTSFGNGQAGNFNLIVNPVSKAPALFQKSDQLTPNDPFDVVRQQCFHKRYDVKLEKGKSYTIDLTGNFDTFLRIEDFSGNQLAQDDDGGGGLNSRLVFRPEETESYRIIVTSCSQGQSGAFTLTIRE